MSDKIMRSTYLIKEDHIPQKPAFPAIDAHNHLWGNRQVDNVISTMDEAGIKGFCDLTSNVRIELSDGGYKIQPGDIHEFFALCVHRYPDRIYGYTMANFARPVNLPLFRNAAEFAEESVELIREHVKAGAKGLKILKELGLHYRDDDGNLINADDPGLAPIFEEAGRLNIPVLIHQADPSGFFEPVTHDNEHYDTLLKYPTWSFADLKFPGKDELLRRRDNLIRKHRNTTFILPHVANFAENLTYVSRLIDDNPNIYIDFSARLDELGRQPYTTRKLFIKHQDRIIFGTDMPVTLDCSVDMYRCYFRFLETCDESFYAPDYDGTFSRARWPICGIGLPDKVLEKIYHGNILKIIPSLKEDMNM